MTEQLIILIEIILIDLVLAGDNAIIIGMVASKFDSSERNKIIFWGIGGAVILRIFFTFIAAYLLQITGLRLLGGLLLLYIVYKLYTDVIKGSDHEEDIKVDSISQEGKVITFSTKEATGLGTYAAVYPAQPKYAVVGLDSQVVEVQLAPGETIRAEPGVMMHMHPNTSLKMEMQPMCGCLCLILRNEI